MNETIQCSKPIEGLPTGLEAYRVPDKRGTLCVLRVTQLDPMIGRATWDQIGQYMADCAVANQPLRIICAIDDARLTPAIIDMSEHQIQQFREARGHVAMVYRRRSPLMLVVRQYINRDVAKRLPNCIFSEHLDEDAALAWLLDSI